MKKEKKKYNKKLNGYHSHLLYKKILERFAKGDCGKREIAEYAGVNINYTIHIIRILQKENIIKVKSFDVAPDGAKRMIYTLVRDVK